MQTCHNSYLLLLLKVCFVFSSTKQGVSGFRGEKGDRGEVGEKGRDGLPVSVILLSSITRLIYLTHHFNKFVCVFLRV